MKIIFLHIFLLTGFSVSFAQNSCKIKKAYAFYIASMPGVQMVDDNGNPIPVLPMFTRFIYVEYIGSKMPEIKEILYNNETLLFTITGIKEKTVSIGDKNLNPNNTITAKKGSTFLKIDLYPQDGKTMSDTDYKNIIIKYKAAGKLCKFFVSREKEFATPPRY